MEKLKLLINRSHFLLRIVNVFFGTFITGLGIKLIISSDIGVDSLSTMILGILKYSSISFGRWSQIFSILFLLLTFLFNRKMIGLGSLINAVFVGETIQKIEPAFEWFDFVKFNYITSFLGFVLMALGTAIYLSSNMGSGPLEGLMFVFCKVFHVSLGVGRISLDFLMVMIGVFLGSKIGFGTLLAIFLLGPLIEFFLRMINSSKV